MSNMSGLWFLFCFHRDEDMQSMASLMSVNNNSDIAPLDDFDNEDIPEDVEEVSIRNIDEILDISAQLDLMTSSLTGSEVPSTPISGRYFLARKNWQPSNYVKSIEGEMYDYYLRLSALSIINRFSPQSRVYQRTRPRL